ncbi:MAG: hypothetical protein GY858_05855 [Candidatus Omnitrophica bacterium]|nr:hypothetical protein [Candidatus Omnitrophota bacterium]
MKKRTSATVAYSYLDSQRIKKTFFTPPKEEKKHKKPILLISAIILGTITLVVGIYFLHSKYELIVLNRKAPLTKLAKTSLLVNHALAKIEFIGNVEKKSSAIYFAVTNNEKIGLKIRFKKPVNLKERSLFIRLKKGDFPFKIDVVAKDNRFFSNSKNPLQMTITKETRSFTKIPIEFKKVDLQNTNLHKVNQVTIYFYPENKTQNWVLMKDIFLEENLPT